MRAKASTGAVLLLLAVGVLLIFWVSPSLLAAYVAQAPREPDAAGGAIHEFNQHGTIVFMSLRQLALVHGCTAVGVIFLIFGGGLLRMGSKPV